MQPLFTKELLCRGAALAPMAGITDTTVRGLCAQHGAIYTVSEMVSAKALTFKDRKSALLMQGGGGCAPYGIQLFGAVPQDIADAVQRVKNTENLPFDFFDLNMGCPAPKITGSGAGSALLRDLPLVSEIVRAAVNAADRPVTVKMRLGWDDTAPAVEAAQRCEAAGAAMLTVHGRTRQEMYHPGIHADGIAAVKAAVKIPVVANGDVTDAASALELLRQTGADGLAVGRGALGNPWLFDEIAAAVQGKPAPQPPTLDERFAVLRAHIYGMCCDKGEYGAMQQARSHAAWYMHGLRGAAQLRHACSSLSQFSDVDELIRLAYSLQKEEQ